MNPNYQTPAHDAPYRPGYSGPDPYSFYGRPSFGAALKQNFSPFYQEPNWGNPADRNRQASDSMTQKPFDAAATVAQRLIMPAVAIGATMHYTKGIFGAFGAGIGQGLGAGIGSHVGAAGPMQLTSGARALGAVGKAAGWFGSFAAGLAVAEGVDTLAFQPYIRARQNSNMVSDHFSGQTFAGNFGSPVTGRGLSSSASARIGNEIDKVGINDMVFSGNQMAGIGSMGMKAGLFDDVGAQDIGKRVSSIASQIKTIMAISKDPNIQSAIAELAKLRAGGAGIGGGFLSEAMTSYSSIGMYASAAGASVQRVMNTVGQQGQYMAQMNGITPYLGQTAAATAFAGFTSARRAGVISSAALARMGGEEGATQSSLAAQMSGMKTPYNQISNYNRFFNNNPQSGVVNNVSAFGQSVAQDPLRARGNQLLYGDQMNSLQFSQDGGKALEQQAIEILKTSGQKPAGRNGQWSPSQLAATMEGAMNIPSEQITAYLSMRQTATNPEVVGQHIQAFKAQGKETYLQFAAEHSLRDTMTDKFTRAASHGWKAVKETTAGVTGHALNSLVGASGDLGERLGNWWSNGNTIQDSDRFISSTFDVINQKRIDMTAFDKATPNRKSRRGDGRKQTEAQEFSHKFLSKLNSAAGKAGAEGDIAREILNKGLKDPDSKLLFQKFLSMQTSDPDMKDILDDLRTSPRAYDQIASDVSKFAVSDTSKGEELDAVLDKLVGGKGALDDLAILGQAGALKAESIASGQPLGLMIGDKLADKKYSALAGHLAGLKPEEQIERIQKLAGRKLFSAGFFGAAKIAGEKNMNVDEVIANPESFTKDAGILAAIRAAGGDKEKVKKLMGREIARLNGGSISGTKIYAPRSSDIKDDEFSGMYANAGAPVKATADAVTQSTSGVDYKEMRDISLRLTEGSGALVSSANALNRAAANLEAATSKMKR